MRIGDLIEELKKFPPDLEIRMFDPDNTYDPSNFLFIDKIYVEEAKDDNGTKIVVLCEEHL